MCCGILAVWWVVATGGCAAYNVGYTSLYRPDITTIHVPVIESDSLRRELGERLTEIVIKKIEMRTPMKVTHDPNADSTLIVRITSDEKRVIAENAGDDPRDIEVGVNVQVTWRDRRGNPLTPQTAIPIESPTLAIAQAADFIPEAGQSLATAQQEVLERVADQIVAQLEMPW